MKNIKIVSDGTAVGTHVYTSDGVQIEGISQITIAPILPGGLIQATLVFPVVQLSMDAASGEVNKWTRLWLGIRAWWRWQREVGSRR